MRFKLSFNWRRCAPAGRIWPAAAFAGLLLAAPAGAGALAPLPQQPEGVPFPTASWPQGTPGSGVDEPRLEAALDALFAPSEGQETRAFLVVHRGRLVAERYAEGFSRESRFPSWSLANGLTSALVATLVRKGEVALDIPAPVEKWRAASDPRSRITLRHLLTMTSGLSHSEHEESGSLNDTTRMLYGAGRADMYDFAVTQPAAHEPGTQWSYATGSSLIVAGIVADAVAGSAPDRRARMQSYLNTELLDPLGMRSAVPEYDVHGTFVGGAFLYASARDFARLGLLFLRDGVWDGRRILPEGWVDICRTPTAQNPRYGADFWLNSPAQNDEDGPLVPGAPADLFYLAGNQGQLILLAPEKDLLVVRLGMLNGHALREALGPVLGEVYAAFPAPAGGAESPAP
ncbi:MAG: serine hydrolase [Alphaproteobacteria bacterium]|nr:serine hydrolase [Alphaproteobacteria bacterium]